MEQQHHAHHAHHAKHAKKASSKVYVETSDTAVPSQHHRHHLAVETSVHATTTTGSEHHQQQQQQQSSTIKASHTAVAAPREPHAVAAPPSVDSTTPVASAISGGSRATSEAIVAHSTAAVAAVGGTPATTASSLLVTRPKHPPPARLTTRLSHDISTEQLLSDQLIDGKVVDSDDDDDDDDDDEEDGSNDKGDGKAEASSRDNNSSSDTCSHRRHDRASHTTDDDRVDGALECPPTKGMYRIESHSALSSLEARNLDRAALSHQQLPTRDKHPSPSGASQSSPTAVRSSPAKPHKLSPLPASGAATTERRPLQHDPQQQQHQVAAAAVATSTPHAMHQSASTACDACTSHRDMPPMHCAAYSGHVECLEALLLVNVNGNDNGSDSGDASQSQRGSGSSSAAANTQPQPQQQPQQHHKRLELDKKHRTPLFYACAANRMDCVALLLAHRGDWRDLPDKQLDTPVHVCCFFGWHTCLARLLDAGANPHVRNAKGFKPSHIAKTKDCLELLLSFGDDLLQGDKLGRTPLFVASARDRAHCVEFLCAWNHETRSWMLEQEDERGDRPIHAAACNGSVAALEILLKYGADPRIANGKALTPKDLASANNHLACVELLARAEDELARAATWYAPANAAAASDGTSYSEQSSNGNSNGLIDSQDCGGESAASAADKGWIECWDYDSGQPFYYHNLSGKCQWEVPQGFTPQLLQRQQTGSHATSDSQAQQQQHQLLTIATATDTGGESGGGGVDDDGSEYVWVKKKKQTVCVVTGKATEWTAVQDPASRAIYYKNTRTGQSQWEEPDAVQQLQSASGAHTAQEASRIWDELDQSRTALAAALAKEKHRQLAAHRQTLERYKLHLRERREEMAKREEQARLQQLLPRSSFVRRKKQSMMIKVAPPGKGSGAVAAPDDDDKLEQICAKEPALDIFLSTYVKLQGVRDLQVMTPEKRFGNCLYHYYVALVDPVASPANGLSKSQFRAFLRDAAVIPSSSGTSGAGAGTASSLPPLKLHVVDLIFAQAVRADALETMNAASATSPSLGSPLAKSPHHRQAAAAAVSSSTADAASQHLTLAGFLTAMQIVRDRVVTHVESTSQTEAIDDDDEWFVTTYLLPLTLKLGAKLLTQICACKELDLALAASRAAQSLLAHHRALIQQLHRHYSREEPKLKMLTFRGLSHFARDFGVLAAMRSQSGLPALHQLYEAVNWISGNAHTEVISFEKFQQLLTMLACLELTPVGAGSSSLSSSTGASAGSGQAWRAVPSFLPPHATRGATSTTTTNNHNHNHNTTTTTNNDDNLSNNRPVESESRLLEALAAFFQQLERSPATLRIQTPLTLSASKLLGSSSTPTTSAKATATMLKGQSSRTLGSASSPMRATGATTERGDRVFTDASVASHQLTSSSSSGMVRAPSTPVMTTSRFL